MELLKKVYNWLVKSSADPAKLSLTLKGGLPLLALLLGWGGVAIPNADLEQGVELLVAVLVALSQLVSGIFAAIGLGRKVWNTVRA